MPGPTPKNLVADAKVMITPDAAFGQFRENLSRFIARRLSNPDDVDDILQDVFVRVAQNEESLRNARTPLAWLYTVTRSVLIDHHRKQSRVPGQAANEALIEQLQAPSQYFEAEFEGCLSPMLSKLPDKYRAAIEFVDIDGGRQTDLAKQTGLSSSAIKSRVQRGRSMLKTSIVQCCRMELDDFNNLVALVPDTSSGDACC